jgi:hypothetical protein
MAWSNRDEIVICEVMVRSARFGLGGGTYREKLEEGFRASEDAPLFGPRRMETFVTTPDARCRRVGIGDGWLVRYACLLTVDCTVLTR